MGTKSIHQNIFVAKVDLFAQKSTEWCSAIANMVSPWRSSPQGHQLINAFTILSLISSITQPTCRVLPVLIPQSVNPQLTIDQYLVVQNIIQEMFDHIDRWHLQNVTNTKIPSKYKQNRADTKDFKANTKKYKANKKI